MAINSWDDLAVVLKMAQQARAAQNEVTAHTYFVRATQLDPNNATAWEGRAAMATEPDDAIIAWSYALALKADNAGARALLTQRVQERIAHSVTSDALDLILLGRDLAQAGQKDLAHQLLIRATELDEHNVEGWIWRAGTATIAPEEAVMCLNHALALDPGNKKAEAGLRWILTQKIAPTQFASPQMVRQAAQQISAGQRSAQGHDRSRAHHFFTRATDLDHTNLAAWLWRASTTTDVDEALLCVAQALVLSPGNQAALDARAFLLSRKRGDVPGPNAAAPQPIAPPQIPLGAPKQTLRVQILAVVVIVLFILLFMLLRNTGFIR